LGNQSLLKKITLQLQPVFNHLGSQAGNFHVAEQVANQCLSLPMSPYLKKSEQNEVIDSILEVVE